MRRLLLLLLPALLLAACGDSAPTPSPTASQLAAAPTATPTLPPPPSPTPSHDQFYSVDFISPDVGWAAGAEGIFGTKDGGAHWTQQYRAVGDAYTGQVDFLDASTGFALSSRGRMSTRDGGEHWTALSLDGENNPERVDFVTPLRGWAIAATRRGDPTKSLLRTDDGGETYAEVASPADSVCFGDERDGWYAGAVGVMRTIDGGATWTSSLAMPLPDWGEGHVWQAAIHCVGRDVSWVLFADGVAAGSQAYAVFRTVDGGVHWAPVVQAPIGPKLGTHVGAGPSAGLIAVVDSRNAWVTGNCGGCEAGGTTGTTSIEATHDGGLTWDPPVTLPPTGAFLQDLQFTDPRRGWLATFSGLFATTDGGRTWLRQR